MPAWTGERSRTYIYICIYICYICGNIYHQYTPNVSIYTIHGAYGQWFSFMFISGAKKKASSLLPLADSLGESPNPTGWCPTSWTLSWLLANLLDMFNGLMNGGSIYSIHGVKLNPKNIGAASCGMIHPYSSIFIHIHPYSSIFIHIHPIGSENYPYCWAPLNQDLLLGGNFLSGRASVGLRWTWENPFLSSN